MDLAFAASRHAIDQGDDRYMTLKAMTGDGISLRVDQSETLRHWNVNKRLHGRMQEGFSGCIH